MTKKVLSKIKKILCKRHKISLSTEEKAQILIDNCRLPYKRAVKKCFGCGRFYVKSKYIKPII